MIITTDNPSPEFEVWLEKQKTSGVALVIIDGLMGAGKSTLLKCLGTRGIDLDDFLPKNETDGNTSWPALVIAGGAIATIETKMQEHEIVVVAGVAASSVVEELTKHLPRSKLKRVYQRRITETNGYHMWDDGRDLMEHAKRSNPYFRSIYEFHGAQRPWEVADLVVDRIER